MKLGPSEKIEVTVFNRDVMAYGVEHELNYNKAREKRVKFVRYTTENLPKVFMEDNQLKVTYFHETLKLERTMPIDMSSVDPIGQLSLMRKTCRSCSRSHWVRKGSSWRPM